MRAYTVATVAVTLGMPMKWVDNVLSQHRIEGVAKSRQGVRRRLTINAIVTLDIALKLSRALGSSMSHSLYLAARLLSSEATLDAGGGIALSFDRLRHQEDILGRLTHAVEIAPSPRRGRPPIRA
jgi:hypothetical protein